MNVILRSFIKFKSQKYSLGPCYLFSSFLNKSENFLSHSLPPKRTPTMSVATKDGAGMEIHPQQLDAADASSYLEHMCLLDIDSDPAVSRKASVICTIGPVTQSVEMLKKLMEAGEKKTFSIFFVVTRPPF